MHDSMTTMLQLIQSSMFPWASTAEGYVNKTGPGSVPSDIVDQSGHDSIISALHGHLPADHVSKGCSIANKERRLPAIKMSMRFRPCQQHQRSDTDVECITACLDTDAAFAYHA